MPEIDIASLPEDEADLVTIGLDLGLSLHCTCLPLTSSVPPPNLKVEDYLDLRRAGVSDFVFLLNATHVAMLQWLRAERAGVWMYLQRKGTGALELHCPAIGGSAGKQKFTPGSISYYNTYYSTEYVEFEQFEEIKAAYAAMRKEMRRSWYRERASKRIVWVGPRCKAAMKNGTLECWWPLQEITKRQS